MGASIFWVFLVLTVEFGRGANFTIYMESAQYRGHYLAGNSTVMGPAYLRNPPLNNEHKWIVDWDLIFLPKGGPIVWLNGMQLNNAVMDSNAAPVMAMPTTMNNWKMTYTSIGSQTYYRFLAVGGTEAAVGCLWDNGTLPLVTAVSNCTDNNLKTLWKVYSA